MIYLDNSATTKTRPEVLETFIKVNSEYYANPASIHSMGNQAEDLLEQARKQIAGLVGMDQIIFTSGGTESNNLAIYGTAEALSRRGRHLITAATEHASVLNAMKALEAKGFEITRLSVDHAGRIELEELKNAIRHDTILVSLMQVNNEIGTVHPIKEVKKLLQGTRTLLHVDAVQSLGNLNLAKEEMPDLLSLSSHKFHGLKGSGILAFSRHVELSAVLHGGGQEYGLRSGTVSVPNAVAFAKALRLAVPKDEYGEWNNDLRHFFAAFPNIRVISPEASAPHILSIAAKGVKGEVLVSGLQREEVIVSTSSACSSKSKGTSHVIDAIGLSREYRDGVIRISMGAFTTEEDIESLKQAFTKVYDIIKGV